MGDFFAKSEDIYAAADSLQKSANHINTLLNEFEDLIHQVGSNYQSDSSTRVQTSFNKVKDNGPAFKQAVEDCSKYLSETVAPNYETVEKTTADYVS